MADVFLDHETTAEDLAAQLPEFMPKDENSGNYKLLSAIAGAVDDSKADLAEVDKAATVQDAETIDQLERHGRLVNLKPRKNETLEHYRARVISEFQLVTSTGTIKDLLNGMATILGTDISNISYTEEHTSAAGSARVSAPLATLQQFPLSESELGNIVESLIPASYRLDIIKSGTHTYISEADYNDGSFVHDTERGYDGLDTNGDPKGNGGTYAGVL